MSGCGARGGAGDWPNVREHAAGIPGRERSYQRRRAVELDAALAGGLGPGELAGVPFHECFRFRRDVEILFEARVCLADLRVSELEEEPIALTTWSVRKVEADDDASIREPVSAERVAHGPQGHKGVEVLGGDLEPTRSPLAERLADREEVVARRREFVVVPAPVGLGRQFDDTKSCELPEPL